MPAISKERLHEVGVPAVVRALGLVAIAAVTFILVLKISMAGAYRDSDPAKALAWLPSDASAKSNAAELIQAADVTPSGRARAAALATDAIVRDPTRVVALRTLGLVAEAEGEPRQARRLLAQSAALSRRDHLTQVWLVNDYYRLGDPARMVEHFDIASRTSQRVRSLLFPIMVGASVDPRIGFLLAEKLAEKPNWWLSFMTELVARGARLPAVVALTTGLLDAGVPEERAVIDSLLRRLATAEEFALAWQVYSEATGRSAVAPGELVRDGGFETAGGFGPFEWLFAQAPDLGSVRQARPDAGPGNALSLIANGRSGEVARQLLRLPAGGYRLQTDVGEVPVDTFERPLLQIQCAGGAEADPFLGLRPSQAGREATRITGAFTVPVGCRWQWLTVELGGDGPPSDSPPWIDNVAILGTASRS